MDKVRVKIPQSEHPSWCLYRHAACPCQSSRKCCHYWFLTRLCDNSWRLRELRENKCRCTFFCQTTDARSSAVWIVRLEFRTIKWRCFWVLENSSRRPVQKKFTISECTSYILSNFSFKKCPDYHSLIIIVSWAGCHLNIYIIILLTFYIIIQKFALLLDKMLKGSEI